MIVGCQFVCPRPFQWTKKIGCLPGMLKDAYGNFFIVTPVLRYVTEGDWIIEVKDGWQLVRRKDEE